MNRLLPLFGALLALAVSSSTFAQGGPGRPVSGGPRMNQLEHAAAVRAAMARRGVAPRERWLSPLAMRAARPRVVAGQYIVRYRQKPAAAEVKAGWRPLAPAGARVIATIPQLGIVTVAADARALAALKADPNVLWVEPNARRYPLVVNPNDPGYNDIDYLLPSEPSEATWYEWDAHLIGAVSAWSVWPNQYFPAGTKGSAAVKIAIIDTGIDYDHPDFVNAGGTSSDVPDGGQLLRSLDRTIRFGSADPDAWDVYGHGTHVTGIAAAATNNGTGVVGNGYNADVISLCVTDDAGNGTASDLAQAVVYAADNGAVVCNVSLGDYDYSQAEQDAINYAWAKGMLVIAAAGNDGGGSGPPPLIYPAALSRVLSVSATSRDDYLTTYSSWGNWVGICAPGGDFDFVSMWFLGVYSTLPTYTVPINIDGELSLNYDYVQGSSMASPQVTGLAALYAGKLGITEATPGAPLMIWRALQVGAEGWGEVGWTLYTGFGRVSMTGTMNLDTDPNPRNDYVGCVTGQVRYRSTVVQNASVVATPVAGGASFQSSTRADGGYRLPNVPAGAYNISATYFGETQTFSNVTVEAGCDLPGMDFNIDVNPLVSMGIAPSTISSGGTATATVTLHDAAPTTGLQLSLSTSNPAVASPASSTLMIEGGNTSATFPVNGASVSSTSSATITATHGTWSVNALVTVSGGTKTATTMWVRTTSGEPGRPAQLCGVLRRASDGTRIAGRTLNFTVAGWQASGVTNAQGAVYVNYPVPADAVPGTTRTITVAFSDAADPDYDTCSGEGILTIAKTVTTTWVRSQNGEPGQTIQLAGVLMRARDGARIAGKTLNFTVGAWQGSGVTNAQGAVYINYQVPGSATPAGGPLTVQVSFSDANDPQYATCTGSGSITVVRARTWVWVRTLSGARGQTVQLCGVLMRTSDGARVAGRTLNFNVDGWQTSGVTNASGAVYVNYPIPAGAALGAHTITVSFTDGSDAVYLTSSGTGTLTVTP